jgi:hypothetical protein
MSVKSLEYRWIPSMEAWDGTEGTEKMRSFLVVGLLRPSMELSMLFNSKLLSHLSQILVKPHMIRFYAGTDVEMRCPTGVPLA